MEFIGSSLVVVIVLAGIGVATYFAVQAIVGPPSDSLTNPYLPSQAPPSTTTTNPSSNVTALPGTTGYNPIDEGDYLKYINYDSPSFDIIPAKSDENKNMTIDKCKQRCNSQPNCVAFGFDANQDNYCTSKVKVNFPLKYWRGNLYVKKPKTTQPTQTSK